MPVAIHCKGCFNPETGNFDGGKPFTQETKKQIFEILSKPYISRFSILGGEPLAPKNIAEIANLIQDVLKQFPHLEIGLYTGYTYNQLKDRLKAVEEVWPQVPNDDYVIRYILQNVDVLVAGPFIQEEKDLTLAWCGSRNQEVIKLQGENDDEKR